MNYLEKIQIPHLPSIYGAMLAGVDVIIMGAGIPLTIPGILDALAQHQPVRYPVNVAGADGGNEVVNLTFNPASYNEEGLALPPLKRPDFLPIVSSESLASILIRRATGRVDGFIIEGNVAGGHNAPPRGKMVLSEKNEPIYGERDEPKLAAFRKFELPFWLAGQYGTPEGLKRAQAEGAAGVQVGTAFALCTDSGILPEVRRELISEAIAGTARVFTDPQASPTGFPFKVADLAGSLSEQKVYEQRRRICDVGFLRQPYRRANGEIGYRCAAEPVKAYVAKGGREEDTVGRKCLCNALAANIGMGQRLPDGGHEKPLITMGDDLENVGRSANPGISTIPPATLSASCSVELRPQIAQIITEYESRDIKLFAKACDVGLSAAFLIPFLILNHLAGGIQKQQRRKAFHGKSISQLSVPCLEFLTLPGFIIREISHHNNQRFVRIRLKRRGIEHLLIHLHTPRTPIGAGKDQEHVLTLFLGLFQLGLENLHSGGKIKPMPDLLKHNKGQNPDNNDVQRTTIHLHLYSPLLWNTTSLSATG